MTYQYATQDLDYTNYASGRVLYNLPGAPAFPVRLASEIFQRARARLNLERPLRLYDPVCGGAYHLCALGFLHFDAIEAILASDVSTEALAVARRNLGLLSREGLQRRREEISGMLTKFGKQSHADALSSVDVLAEQLEQAAGRRSVYVRAFSANVFDPAALRQALAGERVDLVISDVPYGAMSAWAFPENQDQADQEPLWRMLDSLRQVLVAGTLVAVAADKRQKIAHDAFQRTDRFQIGKRQAAILRLR